MAVAFEIDPLPICFCWLHGVGHVGVVVAWEPASDSGNVSDNPVRAVDSTQVKTTDRGLGVQRLVIASFDVEINQILVSLPNCCSARSKAFTTRSRFPVFWKGSWYAFVPSLSNVMFTPCAFAFSRVYFVSIESQTNFNLRD